MIPGNDGTRSKRSITVSAWQAAAIVFCITVAPLGAQSTLMSGFNPVGTSVSGIHLYDVTGFAGWVSQVSPQGGFYLPNSAGLKGDEMLGGSATVGWSRGLKNNISIVYTASYSGEFRYSNLSALSHFFTLNSSRHLGSKWTLGLAATSALSTYDQMLFSPTVFSSVAALPGTFDDLASAVLTGKYNNNQLASLLTGAPVIESPARTLFFGNRVFTSSAATSLSYAHSQRLSINFSASASRSEHLNDGNNPNDIQYIYLLPRAIVGSANAGISYSLTPRTQVGVNLSSSRGFSRIEDAYTSYGTAFIGRTMGQRWFAQVRAGGGFAVNVHSHAYGTNGTTPVFGGTLGYRRYAHSFLVAADQSLGQSYGVGAAKTVTANVAWQWWRPGRHWGLNSNYMAQRFNSGAFGSVNGWRAGFGMTRQLNRHMVLETGYAFGSYSNDSAVSPYQSQQHAVRVSVMWMPRGETR